VHSPGILSVAKEEAYVAHAEKGSRVLWSPSPAELLSKMSINTKLSNSLKSKPC